MNYMNYMRWLESGKIIRSIPILHKTWNCVQISEKTYFEGIHYDLRQFQSSPTLVYKKLCFIFLISDTKTLY